jgi:hypothetical protein
MRHVFFVLWVFHVVPQISYGQDLPLPCPTVTEKGGSATLSDYVPEYRIYKAQMGDTEIYHPFAQREIVWGVCGAAGCGTMSVKNLGHKSWGSTLFRIEFKFREHILPALQGSMLCRH